MKKNYLCLLVAGVISSFIVAGCGGGGDGSSSGTGGTSATAGNPATPATPVSSASAPVVASTPVVAQPASAPVASSQPVTVGEAMPSLQTPQAGSTAASANDPTGIWSVSTAVPRNTTIALVDPHNNLTTLNVTGSIPMSSDFTNLAVTGNAWSISSGINFNVMTGFTTKIGNSTGTYSAKQTLSGSLNRGGTASNFTWKYNAENALAVTQASVAGTWATSGASFTVGSDGTVSGTLSGCNMSGTVRLSTPGSDQNMYDMTLSAAASTGCKLPAGIPVFGNAAILFVPINGSNGFQRSILYVLHSADYGYVAYGQIIKQ
ncbi:hypothetical protein G3O06_15900 [Burkholderia sp. Ac-20345]|uniref:hypothetical protein n=1 Tax=Burkholderia sp. Ac-20345 TaxID=2703891 RepID=UPI00197BA490|nr:hypothetical protein [Burkholderia sp. Ac-20345]MBN3779021.1 hypothetical protein [Burkholderia sp. Ac-20345]